MKEVPEKKPTHDHRTGPDGPAPRTEAPGPSGGLAPHQVQRLQGAVGNAAVARLVAQRYTAPVKTPPNAAPGFRRVGADVAAKKRTMAAHPPAAAESKSAQDAAVAPPDDKEAQGKAANAEKMNAAKPGEFDKAAFVAAVDKAIEAQAPKNLDEADKFSKSGKADKVKDEVDGKVTDGKNTSAKDIETTTKAPPDTSAAKDKPVTPMTPDNAPGNPGAPSAADAIPEKQPPAVTDFSQGPAENDKAMADAEVTEEQLAKGNEPEFDDALKAKKTAETDSAKAPGKAHTAEDQQLATAKAGAAAAGAQAMNTLTATRAAAGKAVDGGKGETKSKDERKRAEVTAKLQKVFDATKKDVETTLTGLDQKVDTAFTTGEKSARDAFTADHKARMKKYKDKRYGGFLGKGRWLKDKFAGMPQEANDLYQESRKLYVARMRTVISSVADMIGVELGRAKARIAQGRTDLKAEVDKLPADLKSFGEEAQQDFAGKFEDLEASVDEKSQQLVQDLANKYTAALNAVDEEIKKLQEANKGLIDKAKDAIVGVIKTINELKNLLLGILAKAASAIMKIIKDPIGFLGNLVKAVGAGLNLFVANIGDHLKKGLVSWLLGTATKAGLEIPERFDLRGIITLITSLLGLTWDNIRTRITRKGVPEEAMTAVETSVPVAQSLAKEGPAGAVKEIEAEAGDLKSTILSKLTEYLVPTVIIAGVTWILSLLNPASAFVRAVKGIIDIVTFVVNQGAQIADFVNAVLDAVIEIANGGAAGVPKMVETALAASIPLLIGFLASLLGIGNLANKVKSVFQAVSKPVNRAIDKIVDFIAKKGKALWGKLKKKDGPSNDPDEASRKEKEKALERAMWEAEQKTRELTGRPTTKEVIKTLLDPIRRKYRLTRLEAQQAGAKWRIFGKINPSRSIDPDLRVGRSIGRTALGTEEDRQSTLADIKEKFRAIFERSHYSSNRILTAEQQAEILRRADEAAGNEFTRSYGRYSLPPVLARSLPRRPSGRQVEATARKIVRLAEKLAREMIKAKKKGLVPEVENQVSVAVYFKGVVYVHSSMRSSLPPDVHPVLKTVLDRILARGSGATGSGHGRCGEIAIISDLLWANDVSTLEEAYDLFTSTPTLSTAKIIGKSKRSSRYTVEYIKPCRTCRKVLPEFGIRDV
ncbi:YwqJ-related putative deaminase [Streptomyces hydrogenans]|uniref:YwqJ-related putative deaminase n=1 Tax=Streptomyces hydrogenans TaxID=1873719 RepID=UPI00278C0660|nr:YwqJ-related putative deaminase [Streptomyces hydrogenans]